MIARLKVDSSEYDSKIQRAAKGIQHLAEACHNAGAHLNVLEDENREYIQSLGNMATVATTARGKIAELTSAFIDIKSVYNSLSQEEKNGEFGKELNKQLDIMKRRIQEGKRELADINNEINGGGGLTGALDNMLGKVGLNVEGLLKFGGAAGVATTALKVAKDAFFASETSLDEWGRTVQSSQSLYQGFLSALNNSDISGFLSRMDEIVSAARDAYNAMDELGTYSAFQQRNVAKGRAGYAQALDEYRLNPTADNKQKLAQANQKVMNDLRESHDKTEAAYQAALRQIATERISGKGMQDAFVKMFSEGNYGDLQAAKSSYKTGRGLNSGAQYYYGDRVYDGRVQDRATGKWRDMSDTEKQQFEFARALSQVNDSQIKEVQALGAQSVAITEQIYQQDRAYNRLAGNNTPLRGGGGSGGGGRRSGVGKTETIKTEEQLNNEEIQKLTQEYIHASEQRRAAIRDEIKVLQERNELIQALKDQAQGKVFDTSNLKQIAPTAIAVPKMEMTDPMGTVNTMKQSIQLELKTEAVKVDETTLQTMLKDAIQNGINGMDLQFASLGDQIANGIDVPDSAWQNILDQYNELREQVGLDPIVVNFQTGGIENVAKGAKDIAKSMSEAASAISIVGNALSSIENPTAKVAGIVAQAIATIAQSFAGALAKDQTTKTNIWAFIGASAASMAAMVSAISQVHSATGYAQGGIVDGRGGGFVGGTAYSGDNIGNVRLDSGELVLNRAQQNNLANALQSNPMGRMQLSAVITGEQLRLVLNNNGRRTGRGEYVTTNFT